MTRDTRVLNYMDISMSIYSLKAVKNSFVCQLYLRLGAFSEFTMRCFFSIHANLNSFV